MILAIILLTAFVNLLLGIISYTKNPKSATTRLLTALTVIFALWTVANYFSVTSTHPEEILFWIRVVMFITAPMGPVLYLFIKAFPHSQLKVNKYMLIFLFISTILVDFMAFTPLIFSGVTVGDQVVPTPGPGIALFALLFVGVPILGFIEIIRKYKKSSGIERLQLRYLVAGIILTFGLLMFTNFISVVVLQYTDLVIFGPMFTLIFVGFVFYAIAKHRLLAIRFILARSIAYTFLIAVLASIYTLGVFFISRFLIQAENVTQQRFTYAILAIFVVLTFEPIKNAVQKASDNVFFRGKYNSAELIIELTTVMASTYKLKELTQLTLHKLLTTLQVEHGTFIIYRKQNKFTISADGYRKIPHYRKKDLDDLHKLHRVVLLDEEKNKDIKLLMSHLGAEIAVPLSERGTVEGYLLLGGKKSGEIYTPQDIKLIEIFGPIISIAIQNAKAYEEIKSFNKTLSDKVSTATKELQESHVKLQTLDKQKDKFLGMASHELKTPITSIKAFTQVLYRKINQKEHKEYASLLENINNQTDKVTNLINDLLNVSNIEEGKLVLKKEKFNIDELVQKTVSDTQYITDTHKIIKEGSTVYPVYGDADRLAQVLSNLLTNAIKYSPRADKVIVSIAEKNGYAVVSVQDFGPGIAKEDQHKIFERFYRTKDHEDRNIAGFGLGLYIAAEIIKRHKGTIYVESNKGKGSIFSFALPLYTKPKE